MKKGPGRPNLGKTETIKERAVTVYVPTSNMFEEWKAEAAMHGVSVSRFVCELVDEAIRDGDANFTPREELEKQIKDLMIEVMKLTERLTQAEALLKQDSETIAKYRERVSAIPSKIDAAFTRKLAGLFLEREVIPLNDIPGLLGIKFSDANGMAKISDSMVFLTACGLIDQNLAEGRWKAERGHKYRGTSRSRGHQQVH